MTAPLVPVLLLYPPEALKFDLDAEGGPKAELRIQNPSADNTVAFKVRLFYILARLAYSSWRLCRVVTDEQNKPCASQHHLLIKF